MIANYMRIAVRNLLKQPGISLINILGLAVGMAGCLLMSLFVLDELSFDAYNEKADRIYRVTIERRENDGTIGRFWTAISPGFGPVLKSNLPEVEQSVRFWMWGSYVVSNGDRKFVEDGLIFGEPSVFDIFTFPLVAGDPATALVEPFTAVLTRGAARKYFGTEDVVGKTLSVKSPGGVRKLLVTGVAEDVPQNSHFTFNILVSFATWKRVTDDDMTFMGGNYNYPTYVLLARGTDPRELETMFPQLVNREIPPSATRKSSEEHIIHLEPLRDVYLSGLSATGYGVSGNLDTARMTGLIAILILVIASVNFINLSTARSLRRSREVGLRKVLGAYRSQLVGQFFSESGLVTLLALVLSVALVEVFLPSFNALTEKVLVFSLVDHAWLLGIVLVATGFLAGSYPALIISRFQPVTALKGEAGGAGRASILRSGLVVLQFTISIALITSVIVVQRQLEYVRGKDLGFQKEQLLLLPASGQLTMEVPTLVERLRHIPGVLAVTASSRVPSGVLNDALSAAVIQGEDESPAGFRLPFVSVDEDFVSTFGMEIVAGRDFSKDQPTDRDGGYLINESAARQLGWTDPSEAVGKRLRYGNQPGRIVGVVRDFNFESLHEEIKPLLLFLGTYVRQITARLDAARIRETIPFVEELWADARPDYDFTYSFLDERFARRYETEARLGEIIFVFSVLAVFVACLGLLGLATYAAERRTKEIGIRKVFGATRGGIVSLLGGEFAKLVLLSGFLAIPLSYIVMANWLGGFAYRIALSWWMFAVSACAAVIVALFTVSIQGIRLARQNPVDVLRYE